MNKQVIEQADEVFFIDEVSDEALEAAGGGIYGNARLDTMDPCPTLPPSCQ
jgi:hypothetical protein